MDRRQQKTRNAIFQALKKLLQKKHFNYITVQEIIDEANIGRSTFYTHFETKDDLLKSLCSDIFDHIISVEHKESSHDYSNGSHDIKEMLEHILCHLEDEKEEITQILSSDSGDLFLGYLKDSLKRLFADDFIKYNRIAPEIPTTFQIDLMTAAFVEAIRWWIRNDTKESPEVVSSYYWKMVGLQ